MAELFAGPWGPVIIFFLRIGDVSLATLRMLLIMRNARWIAPAIALAETFIWIMAAGNVIQNLNSPLHILGYITGFATGNAVGMWLEEKVAYGYVTIQAISKRKNDLMRELRHAGYGVTAFAGQGRDGAVDLIMTIIQRRQLDPVLNLIRHQDPEALTVVGETRSISHGWLFPKRRK